MELSSNVSPLFTETVLKLLRKQNTVTVIDFIKADKSVLSQITKLEVEAIANLKSDIFRRFGPHTSSTFESHLVKSGIDSFDDILGGGLTCGSLYDICGLTQSGKTQICNSIAVNLAINHCYHTLFIDAKNDFSGHRIYKNLKARNCSDEDCGVIMDRIRCESIYDVHEFLKILRTLPGYLDDNRQVKCLVVDSLPALWFQLLDGKQNGLPLLYEATKLMRKIAFTYNIIILLINIVTRWTESDLGTSAEPAHFHTKTTVALGKYWHSVPQQRFLLSRIDASENHSQYTSQRVIKIIKGNRKGKTCTFNITNKGVV